MITSLENEWNGPSQGLLKRSPYEAVLAFCELFAGELNQRSPEDQSGLALRQYYRKLFLKDATLSPLGVYGYASRLAPALLSLRDAKSPVRLLDAGCGYGTESLLFALAGADVTGVELVTERLQLARSRVSYYKNRTAVPLSIQFINGDIMRYLERADPFDIIWTMESISHIHPLEAFLPLAGECLSPGGLLITSDPNALSAISLYRAYRIRGTLMPKVRMKGKEPSSGAPVYEAVERIFSVHDYTRMLLGAGFNVIQVSMSGFMASSLVPLTLHKSKFVLTALSSLQRILNALPIARLTGPTFTIVAQKAGP